MPSSIQPSTWAASISGTTAITCNFPTAPVGQQVYVTSIVFSGNSTTGASDSICAVTGLSGQGGTGSGTLSAVLGAGGASSVPFSWPEGLLVSGAGQATATGPSGAHVAVSITGYIN